MQTLWWMSLMGCGGTLVLGDESNYEFVGILEGQTTQTVTALSDATVDWSSLSIDLLGRPLDPAAGGVDEVLLTPLNREREEVMAALSDESITAEWVDGPGVEFRTEGRTSASLSEFVISANNLAFPVADPVDGFSTKDPGGWLVALFDDDLSGVRMLSWLEAESAGSNAITVAEGDTTLNWSVSITSLTPIPADTTCIDWSELTRHSQGGTLDISRLDDLMVARYDEDVAALETDFLNIETLPEEVWNLDVDAVASACFDTLPPSDLGNAFPGFDAGENWLILLRCQTCLNPAPPYLTRVE